MLPYPLTFEESSGTMFKCFRSKLSILISINFLRVVTMMKDTEHVSYEIKHFDIKASVVVTFCSLSNRFFLTPDHTIMQRSLSL
jgi:hypothetical protein